MKRPRLEAEEEGGRGGPRWSEVGRNGETFFQFFERLILGDG